MTREKEKTMRNLTNDDQLENRNLSRPVGKSQDSLSSERKIKKVISFGTLGEYLIELTLHEHNLEYISGFKKRISISSRILAKNMFLEGKEK